MKACAPSYHILEMQKTLLRLPVESELSILLKERKESEISQGCKDCDFSHPFHRYCPQCGADHSMKH